MNIVDPSSLFLPDIDQKNTGNGDFALISIQLMDAYENAGIELLSLADEDESIEIEWSYSPRP